MADQLQAVGILGRDDGQPGIRADGEAGIDQLTVDLAAQCGLGQARTY